MLLNQRIPRGEEDDKEQATNFGVLDNVLGHQEEAIARLDELALQLAPPCDIPVTRIVRTILVDAFEVEDRSSGTKEEDGVSAHKRTGRTPGQEGRVHCLSPRCDMGHACSAIVQPKRPWPASRASKASHDQARRQSRRCR